MTMDYKSELEKEIKCDWDFVGLDITLDNGEVLKWVATVTGDNRRWMRTMTEIYETPDGKYLALDWEVGFPKSQESSCHRPNVRWVKRVETPVVTITWEEI